MCGIAGTFGFGDPDILRAMTDAIAHRGPDGEYFYHDGPVHLGSRRLAILDPAGGAQPMLNEDGSVVVVYNGEIYNYAELRDHLLGRGHTLETHCDTELLPHLYEDEGIEFAARLNGIFAFALWDARRSKLYLVRDPLGVKPLVFARRDDRLAFGSEGKAVLASGLVSARLDEVSLHLTMNVRYVPGERTLFADIQRLPPGAILEVGVGETRRQSYGAVDWTPDTTTGEREWVDGIRDHLERAVQRQLQSDVPLGVSLSGGMDSTSLVALIRRGHAGPLKTFTLGFDEPSDETADARLVAEHFGTEHEEIVLHEPAMGHLRQAIYHTEEPKVNCLQLYLLHRFIGSHVKVVLSGLGGDELFGGYDIYTYLRRLRGPRAVLPSWLVRHAMTPGLDGAAAFLAGLHRPALDLYARGFEWIGSLQDPVRHYLVLRNAWDFSRALVERVYTREFRERLTVRSRDAFADYFCGDLPVESEALRAEFSTKMVNDLLHNEDTMSMAHSVESRVPFLDLDFVRFAAAIPDSLRFGRGLKGLLKKAMMPVLPRRTLHKPKRGFTVDPVKQYKKDLKTMAHDVLTPDRVREGGVFNPRFVSTILDARPGQNLRWHYFMLWQMIGLELWRELFTESGGGP